MIKYISIYLVFGIFSYIVSVIIQFYVKIGDSYGYTKAVISIASQDLTSRHHSLEFIYSLFAQKIFFSEYLSGLIFVIFISFMKFRLVTLNSKNSKNIKIFHFIMLFTFLTPSVMFFSSVAGKEQLFLILSLVYLLILSHYVKTGKGTLLIFILLSMMVFFRVHFTFPFIILYFLLFFYLKYPILLLNLYVFRYIIITLGILIIIFSFQYISYFYVDIIKHAKNYFYSYDGNTTRYREDWYTATHFFTHSFSGIYYVIFNVSLWECIEKPIYFLILIENLYKFILPIFLWCLAYKVSKSDRKLRAIFFYSLLSFIVMIFMQYPLSYINIGSSIRYQQNILYFFVLGAFFLNFLFYYEKNKEI